MRGMSVEVSNIQNWGIWPYLKNHSSQTNAKCAESVIFLITTTKGRKPSLQQKNND